jgi:plasmid stabilization system protein ParE
VSQLIWSPRALNDLEAIRDHIARDSIAYADLVLARLLVAPQRLVSFPESGRMVPEFGLPNLREIVLRPFRIVYRLRGDIVEVVTIFHSARMPPDPYP